MAEEPKTIIVPAALAKAYCSARTYGHRAAAIVEIEEDKDVWGDVCKDCCETLTLHKEKADAIHYALVQAMDLRCPCTQDVIGRKPRSLTCGEVLDGKCSRCGAKIVVEGDGK